MKIRAVRLLTQVSLPGLPQNHVIRASFDVEIALNEKLRQVSISTPTTIYHIPLAAVILEEENNTPSFEELVELAKGSAEKTTPAKKGKAAK